MIDEFYIEVKSKFSHSSTLHRDHRSKPCKFIKLTLSYYKYCGTFHNCIAKTKTSWYRKTVVCGSDHSIPFIL